MPGDNGSSRRAAMYGENDLSSIAIFSGNYINFGYWQNFTLGLISIDERTESQANLYRAVLRRLKIDPTDVALPKHIEYSGPEAGLPSRPSSRPIRQPSTSCDG